jgi:aspartyl-tRNA(Asn)/glutamyl-tRNA(Gln) amidotransferase subunit A
MAASREVARVSEPTHDAHVAGHVEPLRRWLDGLRSRTRPPDAPPATAFDPVAAAGGDAPACRWDEVVPFAGPPGGDVAASGDLTDLDVVDLAAALRAGRASAADVAAAFQARIDRLDGPVHAFLSRCAPAPAKSGPLQGVPFAIKDIFDVAGMTTTAGSRVMADHVAAADAAAVARLRESGAVLLGKLNTHEFAAGGWGYNPAFGAARNPWDLGRVPGGSSSGSAAAVAARMLPFAPGSDTGGSVRIPAALCGVVGFKPTYGVIPCDGVVPLSWSLDHIGVLCRSVRDAGLLLSVLMEDSRLAVAGAAGRQGLPGLRVGVPEGWVEGCTPGVRDRFAAGLDALRGLGASVRDVALDPLDVYFAINRAICLPESSAWHEPWLRDRPADYGELVRIRLEAGFEFSAVDYLRALCARGEVCRAFARVWQDVDVLASPTVPFEAPTPEEAPAAPFVQLTIAYDVLGNPAVSLPCGLGEGALPVGLQLAAPPRREVRLLRVGAALQAATAWHRERPAGF